MSINLTRPAPVIPVPAADPRDAMMHALAVAENVVAQLADRPTGISVDDNMRGQYGIKLYFHHRPDLVAAFAELFGAPLSAGPHYGDESSTYTSAELMVDGVDVRAWALLATEAVAA